MPSPPKGQSAKLAQDPAARRKEAAAPAGAGMAARYEQLALGSAPWRGCGASGRSGSSGPCMWGHALSREGLTAQPVLRNAFQGACHGGMNGAPRPEVGANSSRVAQPACSPGFSRFRSDGPAPRGCTRLYGRTVQPYGTAVRLSPQGSPPTYPRRSHFMFTKGGPRTTTKLLNREK